MVPYFCLSSLITHFNADKHGESWIPPHPAWVFIDWGQEFWSGTNRLKLLTTKQWEAPNAFNTMPLSAIGSGRGSLVFYNQGSAFHWMLTGHQYMRDAIAAFGSREGVAAAVMEHANQAFGISPPL
jgi:hypothetical protein